MKQPCTSERETKIASRTIQLFYMALTLLVSYSTQVAASTAPTNIDKIQEAIAVDLVGIQSDHEAIAMATSLANGGTAACRLSQSLANHISNLDEAYGQVQVLHAATAARLRYMLLLASEANFQRADYASMRRINLQIGAMRGRAALERMTMIDMRRAREMALQDQIILQDMGFQCPSDSQALPTNQAMPHPEL